MTKKAKYTIWGKDLDPAAISQMDDAMRLPVSVKGALMPDAHVGYGLPIGGVLAVKDAVIPYAVGVDIACRMKLSVLPIPFMEYETHKQIFRQALETQTQFGVGEEFKRPRQHRVMDEDWAFSHVVKSLKASLQTKNIPHLIFFGPSGCGKTSKILACTALFCVYI